MSRAAGSALDAVYGALPAAGFPAIHSLREVMTTAGRAGDASAAWKLRVLIDGLLAQPGEGRAPTAGRS